jgi:hypothetical protein
MVESNVTIGRGRSLSYADLGEPAGPVVFYFHGTPSSGLDLVWLDAAFRQAGLRVVRSIARSEMSSASETGLNTATRCPNSTQGD